MRTVTQRQLDQILSKLQQVREGMKGTILELTYANNPSSPAVSHADILDEAIYLVNDEIKHQTEKVSRMTLLTRHDAVGSGPYDSIKWALETHCEEVDTGEYNTGLLCGNEDSPTLIQFWKSPHPPEASAPDKEWEPPK